jgi:hypothetical protein
LLRRNSSTIEVGPSRSAPQDWAASNAANECRNVDKFRQLLNYVNDKALDSRYHKGILIGNGLQLTALETAERQNQFSNHALLRGKEK